MTYKCMWCGSQKAILLEKQGYFNDFAVCPDCGKVTIDPRRAK